MCGTLWRGGIGSDAQYRINMGQAICVSPDRCNSQALAMELMRKRPAYATTGTGNKNNGFHGLPCEDGVNK
jgi:hypothetical protein